MMGTGMGTAGVREGSTAGLDEALLAASGTREPGRAGVRVVEAVAAGSAALGEDEVMTSPTTPPPPLSAARAAPLLAALGKSAPTQNVLGHCNQNGWHQLNRIEAVTELMVWPLMEASG